jgi:hypothetical protein
MGIAQAATDFMWVDLPHPGPPREMPEDSRVEFPHKRFVNYKKKRAGLNEERNFTEDKMKGSW